MDRRTAVTLISTSAVAAQPAFAQRATTFKDGSDFFTLEAAAPDVKAGQIEVIEFFWYSCPHCNKFEPELEKWAATLPKDVVLKRMPVAFGPNMEPQQRLYYALEQLKQIDTMHARVFAAIHVQKRTLDTKDQITKWASEQGIKAADFERAYDSFSVQGKVSRAATVRTSYRVSRVPSVGIAGKYYTDGSLAKSIPNTLQVADYLINQARRGAKA